MWSKVGPSKCGLSEHGVDKHGTDLGYVVIKCNKFKVVP